MDQKSAVLVLATSLALSPFAAHAASSCPGAAAVAGSIVRGPVLMIPLGSDICVARGAAPTSWVQVQLPPQGVSREVLMAALFAKTAACRIDADGTGDCRIEGLPLAEAVRRAHDDPTRADWRAADLACPAGGDTGASQFALDARAPDLSETEPHRRAINIASR